MQKALEINDFIDIGMKIGLLFDTFVDLPEERLVDQLLKSAHGEMGNEVLTVAKIAEIVEGIQNVFLKVVKGFGFLFHAEPKDPR